MNLSIFPDELAQVVRVHQGLFGGYVMKDDDDTGGQQDAQDTPGEFAPITSQEQLDRIVSGRLSRERAKYADYDDLRAKADLYDQEQDASKTDLQRKDDELTQTREELHAAWREAAAATAGLDPKLAPRLVGTTRDEILADARDLAKLTPPQPDNGHRVGAGNRPDPVPDQGHGKPDARQGGYDAGAERARARIKQQQ